MEDYIDEITDNSWRPIMYINEVHNFNFSGILLNYPLYWNDYVGFIQLHSPYNRKMVRLEVWHGNSWTDLASATASVTIDDYTNVTSIASAARRCLNRTPTYPSSTYNGIKLQSINYINASEEFEAGSGQNGVYRTRLVFEVRQNTIA